MPATAEPEVGTRFTARRNPNGTWNFYDLPMMGPVPKGVRKAPEDIGAEWLEAAVTTAQMRAEEGYHAPLYLGHTEKDATPERCGFIRLNRVAEIVYEGQKVPCVFGDYVNVPDRFFDRFASGELPYRSVEVWDWKKPEINALAVLDSDVPYFRLAAMTGVRVEGETPETLAPSVPFETGTVPMPLAAFRASDHGGAALFAFDPKPKKADEKPEAAEPNTGAPVAEASAEGKEPGEPGPAAEDENDGDAPTDEAPDDDPKVKAADEMVAGVMGKLDSIASALAKLCAVLCPTEELVPAAKPKAGIEPEDMNKSGDVSAMAAPVPEEIAKMSEKPPVNTPAVDPAQFAELKGEIAALREKDKARETRDSIAKLSARAKAELKDYNIDAELDADIAHFAALGQDDLDRFVASFKRHTVKDPAPSLKAIEESAPKPSDLPEIATFAAKLPEDKRGAYFKAAREVADEYAVLGTRAQRLMTREAFIRNHPRLQEFAA